uniref:Tyrosine--tRNA ligase n=1 Tax=candidate division WOR-3 bacterium TaxID=2052148 RepID=A0A7C3YS19_UNCW3
MEKEVKSQLEILKSEPVPSQELVTEEELAERLKRSLLHSQPLRVKLGIDASGPEIHLGFAVVLRKLRRFQELGHIAVLIVGDFTGQIGDPSGRSKTRPQLTREEIEKNMARYQEQIFKILIPEKTEFRYNSEWNGALTSEEIINLTSKYTLARILEREDFSKRLKEGNPVYLHEILYPLFQGYDSVAIKADVELGGEDQFWNLLVGRELMREYNLPPQVIMTVPLLEGLDGKLKMSKSYNNYVGITEPPFEMFGKIMSIPDTMILRYFSLATNRSPSEIKEISERLKAGENPREIKSLLAKDIVTIYHSAEAAEKAASEFDRIFKYKELPEIIPTYRSPKEVISLVELLFTAKLLPSKSEARRKISEGGVYVDGEKIRDINHILSIDKEKIIRVGPRKFLKVLPPLT